MPHFCLDNGEKRKTKIVEKVLSVPKMWLYKLQKEFGEIIRNGRYEDLENFFQEKREIFQSSSGRLLENMIEEIKGKVQHFPTEEKTKILKKLFNTIGDYPIFFPQMFCKSLELSANQFLVYLENQNKKADYPLLYVQYHVFKELISNLTDKQLISCFLDKANNFNKKRLIIYIFKNTEKISWEVKRDLFWEWEGNPLFLLKERNSDVWEWELNSNCRYPPTLEFSENNEYKIRGLLCDLYCLLMKIKEDVKKEDKKNFREKVFKKFIDHLDFLNSKTYEDFLLNSESMKKLKQIGTMLSTAEFWNKIISGIIPYNSQQNKKKNEELFKLSFLIEKTKNDIKIKKLEPGEHPDFTLITQSKKKIGIEIVRYDTPEEMKSSAGPISQATKLPMDTPQNFALTLIRRIREKIDLLSDVRSRYNEMWLYTVPYSVSAFIRSIISIEPPFFEEFKKMFKQNLTEENWNFFDEIYLLSGNEIYALKKSIITS